VEARQPVLWVALAARLGPGSLAAADKAPPLLLESAGAPLELVDAKGRRFTGQRLSLAWRAVALPQPLTIRRRVLGPFPSFETAEVAAAAWRRQGVEAVIAHPADWEVWAEPGATAPAGYQGRLQELQHRQRLMLQLRNARGGVLLEGPLQLRAPGGLRWQGGVFAGPLRLQPDAYGTWTLVEQVPLERYLQGVVPHEIGAGAPAAALAAQAVLARTWALRNQHRFGVDGYHLCSDTQCQVYGDPRQASAPVRRAIEATAGRVLSWGQRPIHAVYHASNGGVAAGFEEAWGGEPLPYLRAFADGPPAFTAAHSVPLRTAAALAALLGSGAQGYGADHPLYRWQRRLDRAQLTRALGAAVGQVGELRQVLVLERGASGRAVALALRGSKGQLVLRRDAIRRTLRQLPSTLFTVTPEGAGAWRFQGGGFGHGAGLSQAGAMDLARRGWSVERILGHYYPGTTLAPLQGPGATKKGP
jgi:SpoIID/LytB domain protein